MEKREGYAPGWSGDALDMMGRRTARDRTSFALPFLSKVTRLLDVGYGPGTITIGLAQAAAALAVFGVDREGSQVAMARDANSRRDQRAVRAGLGLRIALEDRSVDLVFAHAVF